MAARRPLVLDASNRTSELPAGDTLIGAQVKLPVSLRTGGTTALPLNTSYMLAIGLRAGGAFNVQAIT